MRLLALESSSRLCSVALLVDGVVHVRRAADEARNSEVLLPMVQSLLADAGLGLAGLDAVAFGAGPGAFTGLRVACGAAQGLAFGADLPVIAVGTLEVLAESVRSHLAAAGAQPLRVLAGLDARMGELYWAELAAAGDDWQVLTGPVLCRPDQVPLPAGAGWLGVGEAFAVYPEALAARLGPACHPVPDAPALPDAGALVRLGAARFLRGLAVAPELAQPFYVRDKVAQTSAERAQVRKVPS